jgi:hypothetical protein
MHTNGKEAAFRAGVIVGVVLAIITIVEYYLATTSLVFVGVMATAIAKTILILQRYMHIGSLWSDDGGGH